MDSLLWLELFHLDIFILLMIQIENLLWKCRISTYCTQLNLRTLIFPLLAGMVLSSLHPLKSGAESSVCAIGKAKETMRVEFQNRLARIVDSLDSSADIHVRDLALAGVEGGTYEVGEAPLSPRAEEPTLPIRRVELVDAEGDFDLILAGMKSECILPSCSNEPEDGGGSAAPIPEGATGEGEAPRAEDD